VQDFYGMSFENIDELAKEHDGSEDKEYDEQLDENENRDKA